MELKDMIGEASEVLKQWQMIAIDTFTQEQITLRAMIVSGEEISKREEQEEKVNISRREIKIWEAYDQYKEIIKKLADAYREVNIKFAANKAIGDKKKKMYWDMLNYSFSI